MRTEVLIVPFRYGLTRLVRVVEYRVPGVEDTVADTTGKVEAQGTSETLSDSVDEVT